MVRITVRALVMTVLASSYAMAQEFRCVPIGRGDSAAALAQRLTGDARNRWATWFQILDPATTTFVPKTRYDHIRPGWSACIAHTSSATAPRRVAQASLLDRIDVALATLLGVDSNVVLWLALVIAITLISSSIDDYVAARKRIPDGMRRFAEEFVREFERPLLLPDDASRAIRARLRANVPRRRLEVLVAPEPGRRYPNLADHRSNVEYDLRRVMRHLRVPSIVGGAPYAHGPWVVFPFEFPDSSRQAGGQ